MSAPELSPAARERLLSLARRAIELRLRACEPAAAVDEAPDADGDELCRPCGAFVTLRRRTDGELRGCVGFVEPGRSLAVAVCLAAAAAAMDDERFDPVSADELTSLRLEISVLGRLQALAPEGVEIGKHGVVVRSVGRAGLLLPQVAAERGWDRETFLDQTCRKAGLPAGSWREPGVEVYGFTATVFREEP